MVGEASQYQRGSLVGGLPGALVVKMQRVIVPAQRSWMATKPTNRGSRGLLSVGSLNRCLRISLGIAQS